MTQYIDKSALVAEIERREEEEVSYDENGEFASWADQNHYSTLESIKNFIDTLEVIDPYKQYIQYASIEAGIKAHAEDYSFNIESELFQQLTEEQQKLWRKEIEQTCISGGYAGYQLAKDPRYKENLEVKEVDLDDQDIYSILYLERMVMRDFGNKEYSHEELCQEVLKRFKAQKKE